MKTIAEYEAAVAELEQEAADHLAGKPTKWGPTGPPAMAWAALAKEKVEIYKASKEASVEPVPVGVMDVLKLQNHFAVESEKAFEDPLVVLAPVEESVVAPTAEEKPVKAKKSKKTKEE